MAKKGSGGYFGYQEIWHDLILIFRPKSKLHALWNHTVSHKTKVASDRNLTHTVFTVLSRSIPDAARPVHDAIYGAVDVYLKEHPTLTEVERKKVCELIDVKKLSADASIHAAQNDRLLLRMVVQILFHEQVRATTVIKEAARGNRALEQDWEIKMPLRSK
ncbi:putative BTB/POZ domain-containing protein NPY1 [Helianthus annuus]|uniref:BTB/POZ domain-containing protein NPY1 n=1 Tax=Helianthus annuus TaxID=4232 RepID=A0A9K3N238_HELAN|nr:coleoptile phototropism protein 1-like [Helianthus annuus]KAF5784251.1 putative BTB/POZ domain-containing protein NPY1 [Helianthus annuus]KAJ0503460.1 putative NPH3 domain-containing protein [Helianthus annuus]KAJ0519415.1 putative NPH3 domain-containing protein [Helianthus annuus]KAJ0687421.1 putative NPH3 domain-containing protein [Helianthus annuus]